MRKFDIIIRDGFIVNSDHSFYGSIAIKGGKIVELSREISEDAIADHEIDGKGLHILPGLIDSHVHINEPGNTEWEGFETGTRSLAAGGVTTFFDMPLSSIPATTTIEGFEEKRKLADQESIINYKLWGGLVPDNIDLLEDLHQKGVIGFKAFMSETGVDNFSNVDDSKLLAGMAKIAALNSVHAESDVITKFLTELYIEDEKHGIEDFSKSRPVLAEIEAVNKLLSFAELTGCKLHICHVSSGEVISKIKKAKDRMVNVTVETCPHYLTFTNDDFLKFGTTLKCNPPLRDQFHFESLWKSVEDGDIDTIGSDHSPSPLYMKESPSGNVFETWSGISGAQTTLNVLLEEGHWKRKLSLEHIVKLTSTNPAKRFGMFPNKGIITPGSDADITIIDLSKEFVLSEERLFYRHRSKNPYVGKKFHGKVLYTLVAGKIIFYDGNINNHIQDSHVL